MSDIDAVTREDVVRLEIVRSDRQAVRKLRRGLALAALTPAVMSVAVLALLAFESLAPLVVGLLYVAVGGIGGVSFAISGALDHRAAMRALREYDARRQLPVARLVER